MTNKNFTQQLMQWASTNDRPLPWKGETDPYLIWLSEIILQQTRVEQGLPYFEKFKARYPTVGDLANAPADEVMKMWEGLGYYSRARNLHEAAKHIAHHLGGAFPSSYEGIRTLKGVGPYTAAAIASFAFGLPHAVVDGNVFRVLARCFGLEEPIDSTAGKKRFAELAQSLLDKSRPGTFNQAIMDFGATVCTPALPACGQCPMQKDCKGFQENKVDRLPVKSKSLQRRTRFFNYLILNHNGEVFIKKRTGKDIWQHLYEFPLIETDALVEEGHFLKGQKLWQQWLPGSAAEIERVSAPMKQDLTHQRIVARFWEIGLAGDVPQNMNQDWKLTRRENLGNYAFPKVIDAYLKQKFLPLGVF